MQDLTLYDIPDQTKLKPQIMQILSDGKNHSFKDIYEFCAKSFNVSEEVLNLRYSNSSKRIFSSKVSAAISELKRAGTIETLITGMHRISKQPKQPTPTIQSIQPISENYESISEPKETEISISADYVLSDDKDFVMTFVLNREVTDDDVRELLSILNRKKIRIGFCITDKTFSNEAVKFANSVKRRRIILLNKDQSDKFSIYK